MYHITEFISNIKLICDIAPSYKLGHSAIGADGFCDCIGLVIGALSRCGYTWHGIHGTNYAARYSVNDFHGIKSVDELAVGDLLFKGRSSNESGYSLPQRYANDRDQTDYYHVGVVTSVNPLCITHMTTPTIKYDYKIGKWGYVGKLKVLSTTKAEEQKIMDTVIIKGGNIDHPINMRSNPYSSSSLVMQIKQGSSATLIESGAWCKISVNGHVGYVKQEFVNANDETIQISKAFLENLMKDLKVILEGAAS